MIRLKVFISSVQKELRAERIAIGCFLSTDDFLRECTTPRIFEDYPQPLRPNPRAYLDLLRQCQVYLLLIGSEYGADAGEGLSATYEEYRLAQQLQLPTLVCVKGHDENREAKEADFFREICDAHHTYSRFDSEEQLLEMVGKRLREHIETTFAVEPRRAQIEQSELNRQSASPFERGFLEGLSYADLDSELALEMVANAEDRDRDQVDPKELPRLLLSRSYLWKDGDVLRPTVAGALLLVHKPGNALPQARVQMDAFPGMTRNADALDSAIFDAPLPHVVENAVAFIRRNTARPLVVKELKRQKTEVYPTEVLREAVVNAVAHRDYADHGAKISIEVFADRLIISSPGHPPGGQSIERLASGEARSRSRNPLVVQGLSWLELMDERGSGIPRMTRLLEQAGHPKPRFRLDHDCTVIELYPQQRSPEQAASSSAIRTTEPVSNEEAILNEVRASGWISTKVCVQRLGIASATAKRTIAELVNAGKLIKEGTGPATRYRLK
jgi:predicted HTH transcriptional regulator